MRKLSGLVAAGLLLSTGACVQSMDPFGGMGGYNSGLGGYNSGLGGYNSGLGGLGGYPTASFSQPSYYQPSYQPSYYQPTYQPPPTVINRTRYVPVPTPVPVRAAPAAGRPFGVDRNGDGIADTPRRGPRDRNGDGVADTPRRGPRDRDGDGIPDTPRRNRG